MRILVTGSRDWTDRNLLLGALNQYRISSSCQTLVHGGARGLDLMAATVAAMWGWGIESHPADWGRYGKAAGMVRNDHMVELGADVCLAFATSWASGTGACARSARRAGIRTIDIGIDTRLESKPWPAA